MRAEKLRTHAKGFLQISEKKEIETIICRNVSQIVSLRRVNERHFLNLFFNNFFFSITGYTVGLVVFGARFLASLVPTL